MTSTIAKGRIARIDTSEALRVEGVLDVLTHENRPPMAEHDEAYKDDVAPEQGSPFRPLYDDKILFNGQPIALVLAEDWEIARFAASLVRVEYKTGAVRDRSLAPSATRPFEGREAGEAARQCRQGALRRRRCGTRRNISFRPSITIRWSCMPRPSIWDGGGKLTVYDKTQGVQNVQQYLCGVFNMKPDDVRVLSPYVGGAFGSGLRPQYQVVLAVLAAPGAEALGAARADAPADVRARLPAGDDRARWRSAPSADGTLDAITHEAIAVTSQLRRLLPQRHRLVRAALQERRTRNMCTSWRGSTCRRRRDMRAPGAATGVYALECAMDELAVALKLDPLELRLRCYSDRDQNEDIPYTSKQLRECYRQGAEAFGWDKRNPEPRSMRDGTRAGRLGHGDAASGKRCRCRPQPASC